MLLGSGETNLCDHGFSHQLVKAAFRGLASFFNTLLCGYFSLLFPTIAVTMLFCLYSLLITTIRATTSDCNFFSCVRCPLLQIHFSRFFYRVNHMYQKYPKFSMFFFLILIFFYAGELEMHLPEVLKSSFCYDYDTAQHYWYTSSIPMKRTVHKTVWIIPKKLIYSL